MQFNQLPSFTGKLDVSVVVTSSSSSATGWFRASASKWKMLQLTNKLVESTTEVTLKLLRILLWNFHFKSLNSLKDAIQVFLDFIQKMDMFLELLRSFLQVTLWKSIAVEQHLVRFLKPLQPATNTNQNTIICNRNITIKKASHLFLGANHRVDVMLICETRTALHKDFGRSEILETLET